MPWVQIPLATPVALVAQLDRASDFGSDGWGFESLQARQLVEEWFLFHCRGGEIGRHAWLRSMWEFIPCGFKSRLRHQVGPLAQSVEQLTLNQ